MSSTSSTFARRARRVAPGGVLAQRLDPVGVVHELLGAGDDARAVAVPQAGELERVVERAGGGAALGAAGALGELGLAPAVLLAREVLELLGERRLDLLARDRAGGAGLVEQRPPGVLGVGAAGERRARERLGAGAQRGAVAERQSERALAVAEREPRAGGGGLGRDALRLQALRRARRPAAGRSAPAGSASVIVGSTCDRRSVSSSRTTYGGGSSSVFSSALAASSFIVSARSSTNTRWRASNGVREAAETTASSTSRRSISCAPLGATHVRSGCVPCSTRVRADSGSAASRDSSVAGEVARGLALAGAGRAVQQVRVGRPAVEGGAEDGGGVWVLGEHPVES